MQPRRLLFPAMLALGGCAATIGQSSFFPQAASSPGTTLAAPSGYGLEDAVIALPELGRVHAVRLDNPASDATIVYAGGNMSFVSGQSSTAAALAKATGADIILFDYPGRDGTDMPATVDSWIGFGPSFVKALTARGWVGRGPLFLYGLSFGGSQAAGMARSAGAAGVIIEGSAADIASVGRNFIPGVAKPFVRLKVDPDLARFDYLGYVAAAKAPVLLIASEQDKVVTPKNMLAFADQLRARGVQVTTIIVPGAHGSALRQPKALEAVKAFIETNG